MPSGLTATSTSPRMAGETQEMTIDDDKLAPSTRHSRIFHHPASRSQSLHAFSPPRRPATASWLGAFARRSLFDDLWLEPLLCAVPVFPSPGCPRGCVRRVDFARANGCVRRPRQPARRPRLPRRVGGQRGGQREHGPDEPECWLHGARWIFWRHAGVGLDLLLGRRAVGRWAQPNATSSSASRALTRVQSWCSSA